VDALVALRARILDIAVDPPAVDRKPAVRIVFGDAKLVALTQGLALDVALAARVSGSIPSGIQKTISLWAVRRSVAQRRAALVPVLAELIIRAGDTAGIVFGASRLGPIHAAAHLVGRRTVGLGEACPHTSPSRRIAQAGGALVVLFAGFSDRFALARSANVIVVAPVTGRAEGVVFFSTPSAWFASATGAAVVSRLAFAALRGVESIPRVGRIRGVASIAGVDRRVTVKCPAVR
jgi:hypothetical protein